MIFLYPGEFFSTTRSAQQKRVLNYFSYNGQYKESEVVARPTYVYWI